MSDQGAGKSDPPVKATEFVLGVLAAIAIEQTAQGAIELLFEKKPVSYELASIVLITLGILVTGARYYHGNSMHLFREYVPWDPISMPSYAKLATPERHAKDVAGHFVQYLGLLGAGLFIKHDPHLVFTAWTLVAMLFFRCLWVGISSLNMPESEQKTAYDWWLWMDVASMAVIVLTWIATLHVPHDPASPAYFDQTKYALGIVVGGTFLLTALIDYSKNGDYYFDANEHEEVELDEQTNALFLAVSGLAGARYPPPIEKWARADIERTLSQVFMSFMESRGLRTQMFQRPKAALHIGLYLHEGNDYIPIFRYCDEKIRKKLRNSVYTGTQNHIGDAYGELCTNPEGSKIHHHIDPRFDGQGKKKKDPNRLLYQSSVMVCIFWPVPKEPGSVAPQPRPASAPEGAAPQAPEKTPAFIGPKAPRRTQEAIGVLAITANKKSYFSEVHRTLAVTFAKVIRQRLVHLMQNDSRKLKPHDVVEAILRECRDPPIMLTAEPDAAKELEETAEENQQKDERKGEEADLKQPAQEQSDQAATGVKTK